MRGGVSAYPPPTMSHRRGPEYAEHNRQLWDAQSDRYQADHAGQLAESGGAAWGVWQIPESELRVLGDVAGADVLEYGCGAAQWSIALARQGARITGLDVSARQLSHARGLMAAARVDFPLVEANAESTPFDDDSFDVIFCDHGAMTFADPYLTVPETARLLRPGGLLAFCHNTPVYELTWEPGVFAPSDRLLGDYWDMHAFVEPDEPVNFQLRYGEWIALFTANGFTVESLLELRPPVDAASSYRGPDDREWARRLPMEEIWRVRQR
jgi:SAM-dependent methyltransferase